jgi:hypothetical protein
MLLYTLIARSSDGTILVESTTPGLQGNHVQVTNKLLQNLTANPHVVPVGNRKTYSDNINILPRNNDRVGDSSDNGDIEMKSYWNGAGTEEHYDNDTVGGRVTIPHYFHVARGESVLYICLSDDGSALDHRINFSFLLELQKEFTKRYTPNKILKANAYGMEKQFNKHLTSMMHHCNTNRHTKGKDPRLNQLNAEVESIKKVLGSSYDLLIQKQENMLDLLQKSDELSSRAVNFSKRSREARVMMNSKSRKYKMLLVGFAILLLYFMARDFCGHVSCFSGSNEESNNGGGGYYNNNNAGGGGNNGNNQGNGN